MADVPADGIEASVPVRHGTASYHIGQALRKSGGIGDLLTGTATASASPGEALSRRDRRLVDRAAHRVPGRAAIGRPRAMLPRARKLYRGDVGNHPDVRLARGARAGVPCRFEAGPPTEPIRHARERGPRTRPRRRGGHPRERPPWRLGRREAWSARRRRSPPATATAPMTPPPAFSPSPATPERVASRPIPRRGDPPSRTPLAVRLHLEQCFALVGRRCIDRIMFRCESLRGPCRDHATRHEENSA